MSYLAVRAFLALILGVLTMPVWSASGDLDSDFGGDGWVNTPIAFNPANDEAQSVIQQVDGKLVIAGSSANGSNKDFSLARYNSDGSLDTSFNGTGTLTTAIGTSDDGAYSVIQQADGKLVAAGYSNNGNNASCALVRYNSDGSLDTSFNGTGKLAGLGSRCYFYSVIQQADGKLVAAGATNNSYNDDIFLARFNSDGSFDSSFNGAGVKLTAIGTGNDGARSLIQQTDGKLVVAGYSFNSSNKNFAIVRYNSDGSLDTSFNGSGKLTTDIGTSSDQANAVIQQVDGKLVVAGKGPGFVVARYNSDGSLDTSFNSTGIKTINAQYDVANSVIQQADGQLVVAGTNGNVHFMLARYNSNGSLDTGFNGTGVLTAAFGTTDNAYSVIQQADGKLVAAGRSNSNNNVDAALMRCNSNGSLDIGFDTDGKLLTNIGLSSNYAEAESVIQQADGKLVVAGSSDSSSYKDFALTRYNSDGSLDTSFNATGILTTDFGTSYDYARSVIQQADGKLVIAGHSNWDFALARYNANGSLDTTFNGTGKLTTDFGASYYGVANSVIQQVDGKLLVAGYRAENSGSYKTFFALVRYNSDGSLDTGFNGTGMLYTDMGNSAVAFSVIQQANGKLVAAGNSNGNFAMVRYNNDGSLDASFASTSQPPGIGNASFYASALVQQADGKLVAAGNVVELVGYDNDDDPEYSYRPALVRYNDDGSLDLSFNGMGVLAMAPGVQIDGAKSLIQQADGKLVAAGSGYYNDYSFVLVRYNSNGSLDTSFNGTGMLITTIGTGNYNDGAHSVIQQSDGKLVMAGCSTGMPRGQEFIVARFESGQLDSDGDGWVNGLDTDNDGDGIDNNTDIDDDNDGIPDYIDADPLDAGISQERVLPLGSPYSGSVISESVSP